MTRISSVDLVRPLARRTGLAAIIAAFLLTLGTPLSLYWQTRKAHWSQANSYAHRMAAMVRDVVATQPHLWRYDTPKLAHHLQLLVEGPGVERVVIIDSNGRRIDVLSQRESHEIFLLRWSWARVYRGHEEVARVWVAVDSSRSLAQALVVLILAFGLSAVLSTILYVVPVSAVSQAEHRIRGLLEKLETAHEKLAQLNADLEKRVEQRSRQLAETAEALRQSEARLREVAGRAVEATEQERQRVAQELHDGVGQIMTGIRLSLQVLNTTLESDNPAHQRLEDVEKLVDESMDELRRIAMDLHPAALDRLGFKQALVECCSSVGNQAELEVKFVAENLPEELPASVESTVYRLVQECLSNIVRYAEARNVEVRIENRDGHFLQVRVADDGKGFDTTQAARGLGLQNMRDRAALLSGMLNIESDPVEGGTCIEASLPLNGFSGKEEERR